MATMQKEVPGGSEAPVRPASRTLFAIEGDLEALEALLVELGGDVSDEEAGAAVAGWFDTLGEERDRKLNGYARRIQAFELNAAAKKEEERRLAQQRKIDERNAQWLKDRLLDFVRRAGEPIRGKDTRKVETTLFHFTETVNGGAPSITYLTPALELPPELRTDVITLNVLAGHEEVWAKIAELIASLPGADVRVERTAKPVEAEVRAALATGAAARAERERAIEEDVARGAPYDEAVNAYPASADEEVFQYARLQPRGTRLTIR